MLQPYCPSDDLGPCRPWRDRRASISAVCNIRNTSSQTLPRLLLAQYDEETITVYQAYNPSIGHDAVRNGHFDGSQFSFSRMTWIKPNFSWMMHRSGWASKHNQETVLAIRLYRSFFDQLLRQAVPSQWDIACYSSVKDWSFALRQSDVIVQWDPDHHLISGQGLNYRVIQIGIRGDTLQAFKGSGIASITDITRAAHQIRRKLLSKPLGDSSVDDIDIPLETRYPVTEDMSLRQKLC